MKIIFLNAWRGKLEEKIRSYLVKELTETEVFCLQEGDGPMKKIIQEVFSNYQISSAERDITDDSHLCPTNCFKNGIEVVVSKGIMENNFDLGFGLYSQIKTEGGLINFANIHGLPRPGHKLDTPERLRQSEEIIRFMDKVEGKKIIGGDFNILPEAESIKMFEKNGYVDLIKEFGIKNTRNKYVWDKYPETKLYYSDYLFVSPEIKVKSFEVPDVEVSDHLPLILEIED